MLVPNQEQRFFDCAAGHASSILHNTPLCSWGSAEHDPLYCARQSRIKWHSRRPVMVRNVLRGAKV